MLEVLRNETFLSLLLINMIAALGMNLVYVTGQLNVGQAGFMAVGAYTTAMLDRTGQVPLPLSLAAGALAAGVVAFPVALGANRVRGIYLIMGTLAIGEVVRIVLGNAEALGGLQGLSGMSPVGIGSILAVLGAVVLFAAALMASPLGLQMRAIFDDEDASAVAGVATRRVKVLAVVLSAAVVGVAGGLLSKWALFIAPRNFGIDLSFRIALFTLIGGVHSLLGALSGAFFVTYLLEALRHLGSADYLPEGLRFIGPWRHVIYGVVVMVLVALRPEGLVSRQTALRLVSFWPAYRRAHPRARAGPDQGAGVSDRGAPAGRVFEIDGVSHDFGGLRALDGVSLSIGRAEIVALVGPNGAGKTTLIDVVSGRYALQAGGLRLGGRDVSRMQPHQRARAGISRTFQTTRVFAHLTVGENIQLGRLAAGSRRALPLDQVLGLVQLESRESDLPGRLNLAERRRLEIGRAIASAPHIVFLDEPSVGMNDPEREALAGLIRLIRGLGVAVVLVDHNLDLAFGVAERVAVLDFGRLLTAGPRAEVFADARVRQAYLGTAQAALP